MKAIRTRVSRDGQRVTARDGDGNRVTIPVPEQFSEAHRAGAAALVHRMAWDPVVIVTGWARCGEWVHVMLPPLDARTRGELERLSNGACNPVEVA